MAQRGMGCEGGGRASRSRRACVGAAGRAEVLGRGVSLCGGERRSSVGKVL